MCFVCVECECWGLSVCGEFEVCACSCECFLCLVCASVCVCVWVLCSRLVGVFSGRVSGVCGCLYVWCVLVVCV